MDKQQNSIVIIGATGGIGIEIAKIYLNRGAVVVATGRRTDALQTLGRLGAITYTLDIDGDQAGEQLFSILERHQPRLIIYAAGIGSQNTELEQGIEIRTMRTNAMSFTRIIDVAFTFFVRQGTGQIAAISSIAGTKGLGVAPAYSATKALQCTYLQALDQLAHLRNLPITVTDLRPGFVATPLLRGGRYPMQMKPSYVARLCVRAIDRRRRMVVIDWRYRLLVVMWRCIPEWLWSKLPIR